MSPRIGELNNFTNTLSSAPSPNTALSVVEANLATSSTEGEVVYWTASVDAWLARAEEVLQAQQEHGISPSSVPWDDEREEWVLPLASFEGALEDLLGRLCRRPGRWILIAEDNARRHHFWRALAFEDGSLVTETVSNYYLEGEAVAPFPETRRPHGGEGEIRSLPFVV